MSISDTLIGINSAALDTPLNHMIWLNDYKTYGENSYVFQNKDILHELLLSSVAVNDKATSREAFEYAKSQNQFGNYIQNMYGIDRSLNWSNVKTVDDIISDDDILAYTITHETLLPSLIGSLVENEYAMNAICNSKDAMSILYNDYLNSGATFAGSPYLTSACASSSLYKVTESTSTISAGDSSARRIHYNGRCFVLGMSQAFATKDYTCYVTTRNGVVGAPYANTYGSTGLVWRINKFASTANCHPCYYTANYDSNLSIKSYMAILKID